MKKAVPSLSGNIGEISKRKFRKLYNPTIVKNRNLCYHMRIQVECAYSTTIGVFPLKLKEDKPVRLTVRQCGDLSQCLRDSASRCARACAKVRHA